MNYVCLYSHRSYIVIDTPTCGACPISLLAKNSHQVEILLVHPKPLNPVSCHESPPYLPIYGITLPFQVNLHVPTLIIRINICLYARTAHGATGWSISSMLSGLFSRREFIHSSCTREAGNWDAQSCIQNKEKYNETNSPES